MNRAVPQNVTLEISDQILDLIMEEVKTEDGVRVENAVSAAATLAGYYLLIESGIELSKLVPGTSIFVESVNNDGPRIVTLMQHVAKESGLDEASGWDGQIPLENLPSISRSELIIRFEPRMSALFKTGNLDNSLRPGILAITAVRIIAMGKKLLDENIGKSLALTYLIEASKTVPPLV